MSDWPYGGLLWGPRFEMASYPPNLLQALLETTAFLKSSQEDESVTKNDLCKSMTYRLSMIISKVVTSPTGDAFSVFQGDGGVIKDH